MQLLARLEFLALTRPTDTPEQALAVVDGLIQRVNSRLGLVITCAVFALAFVSSVITDTPPSVHSTLRVINALYAFGFSMAIIVNLGGLTLLFTLQRQIRCASVPCFFFFFWS